MTGRYDVAQICLNGHVINSTARSCAHRNKKFCDKCGKETIMNCPNCNADIKGYYHGDVLALISFDAPAYCHNCGKSYPWTEAKIQAARELAQESEDITDDEKRTLIQSIDDLVMDTPKTTIAATRFKKILSKTSRSVADAFRDILVDIVSETAKKLLWPE